MEPLWLRLEQLPALFLMPGVELFMKFTPFRTDMSPSIRKQTKQPAKKRQSSLPIPPFRPVQLARLVDHVPPGNNWLHEMKFDGYRCLIAIGGGNAKAYTRSGLDWSDKFQPLLDESLLKRIRRAIQERRDT